MAKSLQDRMLEAETKAGRWLADGNAASERGAKITADRCFERAQAWHDRATALREKSE